MPPCRLQPVAVPAQPREGLELKAGCHAAVELHLVLKAPELCCFLPRADHLHKDSANMGTPWVALHCQHARCCLRHVHTWRMSLATFSLSSGQRSFNVQAASVASQQSQSMALLCPHKTDMLL